MGLTSESLTPKAVKSTNDVVCKTNFFLRFLSEEAESFAPPPAPPPQTRVPDNQADPRFFDRVQADVDRILTQEKMQAEYKKVCNWMKLNLNYERYYFDYYYVDYYVF